MSDNPYDSLDEDANPYDALDAPKSKVKSLIQADNGQLVPSGSAESKVSAIHGMSDTDKFAAGMGKAPVDLWHGVQQIFGQRSSVDQDAENQRDAPLMKSPAGFAGNVAGQAADVAAAGGLGGAATSLGLRGGAALTAAANPASYLGAAASGAAQGAIQPVGTNDSRFWNAGVGAATGGLGQGIARGVSALTDPITDAANKAVSALTSAGVPLDAAQRSGSILLQRAKAMLSDNPFTAGAQADFADAQQKGFNKAVLATIGESGHAATPDVMQAAKTRIGNIYDDVASRVSIPYDQIEPQLSGIEIEARKVLNDSQFSTVQRNLEDIMQKASDNGGTIAGPQFQNIKKTLDKLSSGSDSDVGNVARDLRQTMNDGLLQSANASGNSMDVAALKTANQQWGNMRKIEGVIDREGNGDISPAKLANVFGQKANRYTSVYGQGDTSLSDLAQAGKSLLPNKTPNSGTASRIAAQLVLPTALGGAEALHSGDWKKAAGAALAGYALPKLLQGGLNAQGGAGRYLADSVGTLSRPSTLNSMLSAGVQKVPFAALASEEDRDTN